MDLTEGSIIIPNFLNTTERIFQLNIRAAGLLISFKDSIFVRGDIGLPLVVDTKFDKNFAIFPNTIPLCT